MLLEYRVDGPPATELGAAEAAWRVATGTGDPAVGTSAHGAVAATHPAGRQRHRARRRRGRRPERPGRRALPRLPGVRPLVAPPDRAARRRRLPRAGTRPARLRPLERAPATSPPTASTHLCGDLLGLLDATGHDDAVFVGHDWGALLVWDLARLHPDRVRGRRQRQRARTPSGRRRRPTCSRPPSGDRFFYILYFQPVGPAEARAGGRRRAHDAHACCGRRPARRSPTRSPDAAAGRGHRLPRLDGAPSARRRPSCRRG